MNKIAYLAALILTVFIFGCTEADKELTNPKADFEFEIDGGEVQFINTSVGADVFAWEFGDIDNGFSEAKNPLYTYLRGGTYSVEVTLNAGNGQTGETNKITKTISLKNVPPSIIIDGLFEDWETVPYERIQGDGSLKRMKWVATKDKINILLEGTSAMVIGTNFDVKFNIDNDVETGFNNAHFTSKVGFDVRGVGPDYYTYINPAESANGQPWLYTVEPGVWYEKSTIRTLTNGDKALEITYSKDAMKALSKVPMSDAGVGISFIDYTNAWAVSGSIPVITKADKQIFVAFDTGFAAADFAYSVNRGVVTFTNYSRNINTYTWDFGDGSDLAYETSPIHNYTENGTYSVTLTGKRSDTGEEVSTTQTVAITAIPVVTADFDFAVDNSKVTFTNNSVDADTYSWNFGDGSTSTEKNPVHSYAQYGTYNVVLVAGNSETGKEKQVTKQVLIEKVITPIVIDGSFDDWANVDYVSGLVPAGSLTKMKYKVVGDKLNILLVGNSTMKLGMVEVRFNTDGNAATGWVPVDAYANGGGIELRGVGPDLYDRSNGSKWIDSTGSWWKRSTNVTSIGTNEFAVEIAYDMVKMKELSGLTFSQTGIYIGFIDYPAMNNWTVLGSLPAIKNGQNMLFIPLN